MRTYTVIYTKHGAHTISLVHALKKQGLRTMNGNFNANVPNKYGKYGILIENETQKMWYWSSFDPYREWHHTDVKILDLT